MNHLTQREQLALGVVFGILLAILFAGFLVKTYGTAQLPPDREAVNR